MAMNAVRLGLALRTAIKTAGGITPNPVDDATLLVLTTAIATEVISEITGNAEVATSTTGTATGILAGGASAPTTGAGTGTVS